MKRFTTAVILAISLLSTSVMYAAGSWSDHQFGYKPQLTTQGTTDHTASSTSQDRIDARLGKEIWVGDPSIAAALGTPAEYASALSSALTAIGSTTCTLRAPRGTYTVADNITVPANIQLVVEGGAVFNIATTKTLTINGGLEAGSYQIFSLTGTGAVAGLKLSRPEWFGPVTSPGLTDMGPAIQAAGNALAAGGRLEFTGNIYLIESYAEITRSNIVVDFGESIITNTTKTATRTLGSGYDHNALVYFTGSNLLIKGGYWSNGKGEGIVVYGAWTAGDTFTGAGYVNNITVKDMTFNNYDMSPVAVENAIGVEIDNITNRDKGAGVATDHYYEVGVRYATGAKITNCFAYNLDCGGAYQFVQVDHGIMHGNIARNISNSLAKSTCSAYYLQYSHNCVVDSNTAYLPDGGTCLKASEGTQNIQIKNNYFRGESPGADPSIAWGGIVMQGTNVFSVTGNIVYFAGTPGIHIASYTSGGTPYNAKDGFISGNKVYMTPIAGLDAYFLGNGIFVTHSGTDVNKAPVIIKDNYVYDGNIYLYGLLNSECSHNTLITDNDYIVPAAGNPAGITTDTCSYTKVIGNTLINKDATVEPKIAINQIGGSFTETRYNNAIFKYASPPIVGTIAYNLASAASEAYWSSNTAVSTETLYSGAVPDDAWIDISGTSTITGWSSFTRKKLRYKTIGKTVFVAFDIQGTSDATATSFTLPLAAGTSLGYWAAPVRVEDNGVFSATPGAILLLSGQVTVTCYIEPTLTTLWTNSGTKLVQGQFCYELD